jgi:hypothetical protein
LWPGKSLIPVSNSMKTRGKLTDPYLNMWLASKGVRKGIWECEAKGQPVLPVRSPRDFLRCDTKILSNCRAVHQKAPTAL